MKKTILSVILTVMIMVLLVGCSNSNDSQQTVNYNIPNDMQLTTVTVAHTTQGYSMQNVVIKENIPNQYELAKKRKEMQEEFDKYKTLSRLWDKENLRNEEGNQYEEQFRIETYCLEKGWLACQKVTETCDDDGCYDVNIECEDNNFNPSYLKWNEYNPKYECNDYKVTVSDYNHDDAYVEKKIVETVIK